MPEIKQKNENLITSLTFQEDITDSYKNKLKNISNVKKRIIINDKKLNKKFYKNGLENIIYIIIIKLIIIINLFQMTILSIITLKIQGIGSNQLFGDSFSSYPKEIYINGYKQSDIKKEYNFNQTDNFVELIWDNIINDCSHIFDGCSKIIEINLSNFNTSQVTNMGYMFSRCSSLNSLDLSYFNTSQVTNMGYMFSCCSSLKS